MFLWRNVNRMYFSTMAVRIMYCPLPVLSRLLKRDSRKENLWLPTSRQLVQLRFCPNCRRKILPRFLEPGLDRNTVVTVPTKPCYPSFPASFVNLRMVNRSGGILYVEHKAFQKNPNCIFRYFLIYQKYLVAFRGNNKIIYEPNVTFSHVQDAKVFSIAF